MCKEIFITGGSGYLGRRLIKRLLKNHHNVHVLVRKGSEHKIPEGCDVITGNPFDASDFAASIPPGSVFVQLLGVSHPGPAKKFLFEQVDYASVKASCEASREAGISHFVYVSVAQTPTTVMKDYQMCRAKCEDQIRQSHLPATFIRPWYIIGPGHYWPLLFYPLMKLMELWPSTSQKAKALRLVYLPQMLDQLEQAIEADPPEGVRIIENTAIHETTPAIVAKMREMKGKVAF